MNRLMLILTFSLFLIVEDLGAQTEISGRVTDSTGTAIPNAAVVLKRSGSNTVISYVITNTTGMYRLKGIPHDSLLYTLEVTCIGYAKKVAELFLHGNEIEKNFTLVTNVRLLENINIKSAPPVVIKNDTTEFKASAYATEETRKVQDLLKNIPGFKIDGNGRIWYNGKEVEKILIEGTDLANNQYSLVSKNLSAYVVDKIQLIDNYNENSILRQLTASEKVGINLKLKTELKNKVSGSVVAGNSFFKRTIADINLLSLGMVKTMSIANHNNTGSLVARDQFAEMRNGSTSAVAGLAEENTITTAGTINTPPLSPGYTYNNNDLTTALMMGWQGPGGMKNRAAVNFCKVQSTTLAAGAYTTLLDSNTYWSNISTDILRERYEKVLVDYTGIKANQRRVSQVHIAMIGNIAKPEYKSAISGDVTDTAEYRLKNLYANATLHYQHTEKIDSTTGLHLQVKYNTLQGAEDYSSTTARYQNYFGLSGIYKQSSQEIILQTHTFTADAKLLKTLMNTKLQTGVNLRVQSFLNTQDLNFRTLEFKDSLVSQRPSSIKTRFYEPQAYLQILHQLNSKVSLGLQTAAGSVLTNVAGETATFFTTSNLLEWSFRNVSTSGFIHSARLKCNYSRKPPAIDNFYLPDILSGNATVLRGATSVIPEISKGLSLMYSFGRVLKGTVNQVVLAYTDHQNQYISNLDLSPNLAIISKQPSPKTQHLLGSFSTGYYVRQLKTKTEFITNFSAQRYIVSTNGLAYLNHINTLTNTVKFNTAFEMAINFEAAFNLNYVVLNSSTADFSNANRLFTNNSYLKLKMNPSKEMYCAFLVNNYLLTPGNRLTIVDLYSNYRFRKMAFTITLHNLGNLTRLEQKTLTAYSSAYSSFALIPRFALFKVTCDL